MSAFAVGVVALPGLLKQGRTIQAEAAVLLPAGLQPVGEDLRSYLRMELHREVAAQ